MTMIANGVRARWILYLYLSSLVCTANARLLVGDPGIYSNALLLAPTGRLSGTTTHAQAGRVAVPVSAHVPEQAGFFGARANARMAGRDDGVSGPWQAQRVPLEVVHPGGSSKPATTWTCPYPKLPRPWKPNRGIPAATAKGGAGDAPQSVGIYLYEDATAHHPDRLSNTREYDGKGDAERREGSHVRTIQWIRGINTTELVPAHVRSHAGLSAWRAFSQFSSLFVVVSKASDLPNLDAAPIAVVMQMEPAVVFKVNWLMVLYYAGQRAALHMPTVLLPHSQADIAAACAQAVDPEAQHACGSPFVRVLEWPYGSTWIPLHLWTMPARKTKLCSLVLSRKRFAPGHEFRHQLASAIRRRGAPCDLFGHDNIPLDDKADALREYMFHVAVENTDAPGAYFSEKGVDAIALGSVVLYWGGPGLPNVLRAGSGYASQSIPGATRAAVDAIIQIKSIDDFFQRIVQLLTPQEYQRRINAVAAAQQVLREIVPPERWLWKNVFQCAYQYYGA